MSSSLVEPPHSDGVRGRDARRAPVRLGERRDVPRHDASSCRPSRPLPTCGPDARHARGRDSPAIPDVDVSGQQTLEASVTPSASTQSWATYTWFMMNASSPITVGCFQPWWICAYSRITLPSPIRAPAPAVRFRAAWVGERSHLGRRADDDARSDPVVVADRDGTVDDDVRTDDVAGSEPDVALDDHRGVDLIHGRCRSARPPQAPGRPSARRRSPHGGTRPSHARGDAAR